MIINYVIYINRSLTFSRINTSLVIGDSNSQVGEIDVSSGSQQFKYVMAHEGIISSLAYTACGQLLFSGGNDCKGNNFPD